MDGVIDIEKARELAGNATLWPRMRDFLWDFAPQVHESWLDGSVVRWLGSEEADRSSNHPTTQPHSHLTTQQPSWRIKKFILDSLGVEPCFHDFPKDDGSRIALLDGATLLEIAKWLGALACAEELRKVTDGKTVRALKAALPGVYPDVFGYTAYFRGLEKLGGLVIGWLDDADGVRKLDGDFVIAAGYALLENALAHLSAPVLQRFRLKLPRHLTTQPPNHPTVSPPNLQLLLKLRFPEAYALCSS